MKKSLYIAATICINLISAQQVEFNELLKCNLLGKDIASECNVTEEIIYHQFILYMNEMLNHSISVHLSTAVWNDVWSKQK